MRQFTRPLIHAANRNDLPISLQGNFALHGELICTSDRLQADKTLYQKVGLGWIGTRYVIFVQENTRGCYYIGVLGFTPFSTSRSSNAVWRYSFHTSFLLFYVKHLLKSSCQLRSSSLRPTDVDFLTICLAGLRYLRFTPFVCSLQSG